MKKILLAGWTIGLLSLAITSVCWAIPVTWGVIGHQYEVVSSQSISWDNARTGAQGMGDGWDLATITSIGEQNFITSLIGPADGNARLCHADVELLGDVEGEEREEERAADPVDEADTDNHPEQTWKFVVDFIQTIEHLRPFVWGGNNFSTFVLIWEACKKFSEGFLKNKSHDFGAETAILTSA